DLRLALDARDGVWHFTQALAGRSLGALGGALTARTDPKAIWPPADAPLQGVMELQIANLAAWGAWAPPGWRLQGRVHASASFGGRLGAPEYSGQVTGSELGVRNLVEGVDLHDGELDIALEGETAQVRTLRALAGDGSLAVTGDARFGATPQLDLKLVADKMRLLGRVDRRVVVSGNAALGFKPGTLALDGRFAIDEGLIDISRGNAPQLGDDVTVVRGPPPEAAGDAQAPARRSVREVAMNVRVDLGRALRLRGRGLDTRLEGDLTFTAPDGRLAVNGVVRAVQGTYAAYNQRLKIERGTITFSGALDNPRLDILAARPNLDVQVGVAITGTTRQPRVSLYSSPDMSDNAKLSWLVLGRPPEESSGGDTALLQAAAMAILAGEGDSAAAQLARLNPLDTFSVHQTADGNVRNTVLTVGKQLSQRWYIGYERSLSQTSGNWQLIYRLAQRVTVRLQTGVDNSIDVIWTWRWQ
ncbi:MAG: translocation/assembly module TamB domain-containing protein, partial [Rubrivivax sp.]